MTVPPRGRSRTTFSRSAVPLVLPPPLAACGNGQGERHSHQEGTTGVVEVVGVLVVGERDHVDTAQVGGPAPPVPVEPGREDRDVKQAPRPAGSHLAKPNRVGTSEGPYHVSDRPLISSVGVRTKDEGPSSAVKTYGSSGSRTTSAPAESIASTVAWG